MQQRRPHTLSAANGDVPSSLEERRAERRTAKERRGGGKKLKRVKRSTIPKRKKTDFHVQLAIMTFGLFALIGVTVFRTFGGSTRRRRMKMKYPAHEKKGWKPKSQTDLEYNSDKVKNEGSFLSNLRGKYIIPDSLRDIGNKQKWYAQLRREYDTEILLKNDERSLSFVESERKKNGEYKQAPKAQTPYDINNCPTYPPEGYPVQWAVLEVLENWNPNDATPHKEIYQGVCIFDYRTELDKANNYRHAELPFIMRDDPAVARTAERWNAPGYLEKLLMGKEDKMRRTEYSPNNHFMYWVDKRPKGQRRAAKQELREARREGEEVHDGFGRGKQAEMAKAAGIFEHFNELKEELGEAKEYAEEHEDDDEAQEAVMRLHKQLNRVKEEKDEVAMENWRPPTENLRMTYTDWLEHANVTDDELGPDNPHWYFRLIGCGTMGDGDCDNGNSEWLFDELTFFQPREGEERPFYLIQPKHQKGIHCRFGMKGVIAENHFDLSRNVVTLLGGQRRYILAHPNQCNDMNLLPRGHPSARHSAVDWGNPDLESFPTFENAHVNEIVMQAGDVLYLPTNWFHYIISLDLNFQCNTRSGGEDLYSEEINDCGF